MANVKVNVRVNSKVNDKSAHATQYVRRAETQCPPREPRRAFLAIGLRRARAQPLGMDIVFAVLLTACGSAADSCELAVMQRRADQPRVGAALRRGIEIVAIANAARADQRPFAARVLVQCVERIEIGAFVGAHAVERHDDYARGP